MAPSDAWMKIYLSTNRWLCWHCASALVPLRTAGNSRSRAPSGQNIFTIFQLNSLAIDHQQICVLSPCNTSKTWAKHNTVWKQQYFHPGHTHSSMYLASGTHCMQHVLSEKHSRQCDLQSIQVTTLTSTKFSDLKNNSLLIVLKPISLPQSPVVMQ